MPAILYCYSNMGRHYIPEYLAPSDSMGRHYIHEYLTPSESEGLNLMNIMPTHMPAILYCYSNMGRHI